MNTNQIKDLLLQVFHEIAPEIDFLKVDTARPLRDQVEIDSFDFYRIIVQLHQKTGIYVPDSKVMEFTNLDELIKYISEQPSPHPQQSPGL
jgi:acyl carrier protein